MPPFYCRGMEHTPVSQSRPVAKDSILTMCSNNAGLDLEELQAESSRDKRLIISIGRKYVGEGDVWHHTKRIRKAGGDLARSSTTARASEAVHASEATAWCAVKAETSFPTR